LLGAGCERCGGEENQKDYGRTDGAGAIRGEWEGRHRSVGLAYLDLMI
jgi:hypothetical protein